MGATMKEAIAIASRYADPKKVDLGMNVVVLRAGRVRATNGDSGCDVPCEAVAKLDLAVDCARLRKMLNAAGDGADVEASKGRKLIIKGAGVRYQLQAIPKDSEPQLPEMPDGDWADVTAEQMVALAAISQLVDSKATGPLAGVRLTPEWCAGASQFMCGFAWTKGLVAEPFLCSPTVLSGMVGAGSIQISGRRLFLRTERTGHIEWSLGLEGDWPDAGMVGSIGAQREAPRLVAPVPLADLGLLAQQCAVVMDNKAVGALLTIVERAHAPSTITMEIKQGQAAFTGEAPIPGPLVGGVEDPSMGVGPDRLALACQTVEAAGGDGTFVSVAGPLAPMLLWNEGAPVIVEVAMMPMRLE